MSNDREGKRFFTLGKPYLCPKCGWVLKGAASNTDHKRDIVCKCPALPLELPPEGKEDKDA